jgi:hypothetical protein
LSTKIHAAGDALERAAKKWTPVFRESRAFSRNPEHVMIRENRNMLWRGKKVTFGGRNRHFVDLMGAGRKFAALATQIDPLLLLH